MQTPFFYLKNPRIAINIFMQRVLSPCMSDSQYVKMKYKFFTGHSLNLSSPKTFNEKMNWLKVYDHNPIYTQMADKYAVKQMVADKIGEEYVVMNYGVWERWEDIDFAKLPNQFVLKGTHDSGGAFICRDKESFDFAGVGRKIKKNMKRDFYWTSREWPYKNIPHRIIADKLLDDHTGRELRDYKFWCFNGVPKYMYCTIKGENVYENFYNMDFEPVMIDHGFPRHKPEFEKPVDFEIMKGLAAKLSEGVPFVRVDFFDVDGKVFFGEYTFFDWGGMRPFGGDWDERLGELIKLPSLPQ